MSSTMARSAGSAAKWSVRFVKICGHNRIRVIPIRARPSRKTAQDSRSSAARWRTRMRLRNPPWRIPVRCPVRRLRRERPHLQCRRVSCRPSPQAAASHRLHHRVCRRRRPPAVGSKSRRWYRIPAACRAADRASLEPLHRCRTCSRRPRWSWAGPVRFRPIWKTWSLLAPPAQAQVRAPWHPQVRRCVLDSCSRAVLCPIRASRLRCRGPRLCPRLHSPSRVRRVPWQPRRPPPSGQSLASDRRLPQKNRPVDPLHVLRSSGERCP